MWLAFYNPKGIGDVLLLTRGPLDPQFAQVEKIDQVTFIYDEKTQDLVSLNLFGLASQLGLEGSGQVFLSQEQVDQVNQVLGQVKSGTSIQVDNAPKFKVGYVETCQPHPDSDHLSLTTIRVSDDRVEQIVCGAANIRQGLKVLVALPGAVMPNGQIIWKGQLRGVDSNGMVCSTRELDLSQIEDKPGIWELKDDLPVGMPLEQVVQAYQA